jgi:hypothetical protein
MIDLRCYICGLLAAHSILSMKRWRRIWDSGANGRTTWKD